MRIIVLGYIVRFPLGGMSWHYLHYLLGLRDLGHDVFFLEDSEDYPCCYDPTTHETGTDPTFGLRYAADVMDRVGFAERWAFYDVHTGSWLGPGADRAVKWCADADLLINVSVSNPLRDWHLGVPKRVVIDTDPVFTQVRNLTKPHRRERTEAHNAFFTFGEKIGAQDCRIPDDGYPWRATRQPVALNAWPFSPGPKRAPFSTVMQWDSYVTQTLGDISYGMKSISFEPYMDLPARTDASLEIALGTPSAPREKLVGFGWTLRNPLDVTRDPWSYRDYICDSKGEFSVAKHGYVIGRTGWFSERTACYLAAGRPAVVQDTGFSDMLPTGRGLLGYDDPAEAAACLDAVDSEYIAHCKAAREIAESCFAAGKVLSKLLEDVYD